MNKNSFSNNFYMYCVLKRYALVLSILRICFYRFSHELILVNRDFSSNEKTRSVIWISVLLGVFASVGSVAAVLFSIYVKERYLSIFRL